jgi:starch synthase/alpha-amylase
VAHDTGGIHDTIAHLDVEKNIGNGFLFETLDSEGLAWAIEEAMKFYRLPQEIKEKQILRIMRQSNESFNYNITAGKYIELYEKMLNRPFLS